MSALDVLPREVLAKCLEFLSFDQAVEAKQVSKDVRSAARRALIVHWRPIKFVAERGYDLIRASGAGPTRRRRSLDAVALATFRAAWELDPGLVVLEIGQWSRRREAAKFLTLVEPRISPRILSLASCGVWKGTMKMRQTSCILVSEITNAGQTTGRIVARLPLSWRPRRNSSTAKATPGTMGRGDALGISDSFSLE